MVIRWMRKYRLICTQVWLFNGLLKSILIGISYPFNPVFDDSDNKRSIISPVCSGQLCQSGDDWLWIESQPIQALTVKLEHHAFFFTIPHIHFEVEMVVLLSNLNGVKRWKWPRLIMMVINNAPISIAYQTIDIIGDVFWHCSSGIDGKWYA